MLSSKFKPRILFPRKFSHLNFSASVSLFLKSHAFPKEFQELLSTFRHHNLAWIFSCKILTEKIPNNAQIQPKIGYRIIGSSERFVFHEGLVQVLSFNEEEHSFHLQVKINVANWLSADGIGTRVWWDKLVQNREIFVGWIFCEIINFDSCLNFCCIFKGFRLPKKVDSSYKIRHRIQIFVA